MRDLRGLWAKYHDTKGFRGRELYLLRNRRGTGVRFFQGSGFYPDFIVWLSGPDGTIRVRFVEPHGMHHGGLAGNRERIEAVREPGRLNANPAFRSARLDVGGYVVTETALKEIEDVRAAGLSGRERGQGPEWQGAGPNCGRLCLVGPPPSSKPGARAG